jgi:hypothetical protein
MLANPKQIEPPTDDKRWRIVQAAMRRNGFKRSALIETLHIPYRNRSAFWMKIAALRSPLLAYR